MATIFLSYAHVDNVALGFEPKGWILRLNDDLEKWAKTLPKPRPEFWIDHKRLQIGQVFKRGIDAELKRATFFVPIISPRWFENDYCRKIEWPEFWKRS